jgi:hypothetical protein|tara:strand:- start:494 stop:904 length:411 start_codon:yes stop_codon:yes gene_type:complete
MFGDLQGPEDDNEKPKKGKKNEKINDLLKNLRNLAAINTNEEPDEVKITIKNGMKKTVSTWKRNGVELTTIDIVKLDIEEDEDAVPELDILYYDLSLYNEAGNYEKSAEVYKEIKKLERLEAKALRAKNKNKLKKD